MLVKVFIAIIIILGLSGGNLLLYISRDDLTEAREEKAVAGIMSILIFSAALIFITCRGVLE